MSKLELGTVKKLLVEDQNELGYILSNGKDEVLLPEGDDQNIQIGSEREVFLYLDKKGDIVATESIPVIQFDQFGWAEVKEVRKDLGVYVDIGIPKEILVSRDDLPLITEIWPKKGDKLYVTLGLDHRGRLLAIPATEEDIQDIAGKAPKELHNKEVTGRVYRAQKVGTFLITDEHYRCFIHESERKEEPRLGSLVTGRVIAVKEDGSLNVSLLPRKQESLDSDTEIILSFLEKRESGAMPYGDKSQPEDIQAEFGMSKAAFKRALGKLMKDKKVYQKSGWTYLMKEE